MALAISIVDRKEVDARAIAAHPLNSRIHPIEQRADMLAVLNNIGWVGSVLVNRRTGRLLDGHLRVDIAAEFQQKIQVRYIDVDEKTELEILATYDQIGQMADTDKDVLWSLIEKSDLDGALGDVLLRFAMDEEISLTEPNLPDVASDTPEQEIGPEESGGHSEDIRPEQPNDEEELVESDSQSVSDPRPASAEQSPSGVKIEIGIYTWYVDQDVYSRWKTKLQALCGNTENCRQEIIKKLGIPK